MGKFINEVRASKISHPTQKSFSVELWEKTYNSHSPHNKEDQNLFEAGLWVFCRLNAIRNRLSEISFKNITKSELVRYLCGFLNRSSHIISQKEVPLVGKDTYIAESLIQMKTPENIPHPNATPDELTIAAVDGARYPLSSIQSFLGDSIIKKQTDPELLDMIRITMMLGSLYDSIETIWMDCLWLGKYIQKKSEYELVIDSDIEVAINIAVSDYRRQSLMLQFTTLSIFTWKHSLPEQIKRQIYCNAFEVKIERLKKKKKFSISPREYDAERPPATLMSRLLAQKNYFQKLLTVKLPNYHDFTLEQLLTAWEILHSLSSKLFSMFPMDSGVYKLNKLIQYAPTIAKNELAQLFSKAMKVSYKEAEQIANIFIFQGNPREELWFYPLVEVDEKKVCPVMSAILYPNLLRNIEHWLTKGGLRIDSKGEEFEKENIVELKEAVKASAEKGILNDVQIHTISKNSFGEQIDLIIKLRNTFLVGEVKCTVYPTDPLEFYRYYELIKSDAVPQIKRKVDFIRHNREKFLEVLGLTDKINLLNIKLIPFIFTNHPYCVGFPIDTIPIVDRYILNRYIDSGGYDMFVLFEQNGSRNIGKKIIFYRTEEEAENKLETYLLKPPQVELFKKFITHRIFPIPLLNENDKKAAYVKVNVELPLPSKKKDTYI